jgi:hypothetical protein
VSEYRGGRHWDVTVIHDPDPAEDGTPSGELVCMARTPEWAELLTAVLNAYATSDPRGHLQVALVMLDRLPLYLRNTRHRLGLSYRAIAKQVGIAHATVKRAESGLGVYTNHAIALLEWVVANWEDVNDD